MRRIMAAIAALATAGVVEHAQAEDDGYAEAQLVVSVSGAGDRLGEGVERLGEVHTGRLRTRRPRRRALLVPADRCVVVIAHAEPSVDNLDVSLSRGRTKLARDTTTERKATARWCAGERAARVRLRVQAFRGHGRYAEAAFLLPEGAPREPQAEAEAGGSALERLAARVDALAEGQRPVSPARRETVAEGDKVVREVPLAPGRCYRVLAAAEAGIEDLDLAVVDPRGGLLQQDTGQGGDPTVGVLRPLCPATPGRHRLVMRAERGEGTFAWRVLGSRSGEPDGDGETRSEASQYRVGGSGAGYVAKRIRARHREVGRGSRPVTDLRTASLRTGQKKRFDLQVEGGRCYVVIAAGVPSVRELDLRILDSFGSEAARAEGDDATPSARVCPSVGTEHSIELDMFNGYGRFGVQAFVER